MTTPWQRLERIQREGFPRYLYRPTRPWTDESGRRRIGYRRPTREKQRKEVQRVFRECFEQADSRKLARQVVRRYVGQFPHLAWEPDSWFWSLWWEWRARSDREARSYLRAVARGVSSPAFGCMPRGQWQANRLKAARSVFDRLKQDKERLRGWYRDWLEGTHARPQDRREYDERSLVPLLDRIERLSGYRPTRAQLLRKKLSGVIPFSVAKAFRVRERDLRP